MAREEKTHLNTNIVRSLWHFLLSHLCCGRSAQSHHGGHETVLCRVSSHFPLCAPSITKAWGYHQEPSPHLNSFNSLKSISSYHYNESLLQTNRTKTHAISIECHLSLMPKSIPRQIFSRSLWGVGGFTNEINLFHFNRSRRDRIDSFLIM